MNQGEIYGEETVFGLDIGTRSIIGTIGYKKGEHFEVVAQEIREHRTRAMLEVRFTILTESPLQSVK